MTPDLSQPQSADGSAAVGRIGNPSQVGRIANPSYVEPISSRPDNERLEVASTVARRLIVNADDFGLSSGVNAGIIAAFQHGIVTSTSLMVRWPAAGEAARFARDNPDPAVGLHLDFGEWQCEGGTWEPLYEVVPMQDAEAVRREAWRQAQAFVEMLGRSPTHVDSHQHLHRDDPLRKIVLEMARRWDVPVRHFSPEIRYCGDFYGQSGKGEPWPEGITAGALVRLLEKLPAGITELGCHPGWDDDLKTMYCRERRQEASVLCAAEVRAAIAAEGIELISFADVARAAAPAARAAT